MKGIINFLKNLFNFITGRQSKINDTVIEASKVIDQLTVLFAEYQKASADNQITFSEALVLLDQSKALVAQLEIAKRTFDNIFKD